MATRIPISWWLCGAIGCAIAASLPLVGNWLRSDAAQGCSLDGATIDAQLQVRMTDAQGGEHRFCCLTCAELWLELTHAKLKKIYVVDEATGAELDHRQAWYVYSSVMTQTTTQERRHVFRDESDARAHAEKFFGRLLTGAKRPFADLP